MASTKTGWCKNSLASFFISFEKVAENSKFCLFEGSNASIFLISRRKPISSILSASSNTSISTFESDSAFWLSKSSNLPGVATKISTPLRNARICGFAPTPPKITVERRSVNSLYSLNSSCTCAASSRVGVNINARTGRFLKAGSLFKICSIGNAKPAVFPLPVCAEARTSFRSKIKGIAFC